MSNFTNRQKADEARKEVGYRDRVYRRLIEQGKMNPMLARKRIAIMQEIGVEYARQAEADEAKERLI